MFSVYGRLQKITLRTLIKVVEDYIYQLEGQQKEVMQFLHDILTIEYGLNAKIRYKIPFYFGISWICYLNTRKNNKVDFAIVRGQEISNASGLLDSRDRKMISSAEFGSIKEIPVDLVKEIIEEAIFLDETVPYKLRRKA